ncbi:hypothetical protein FF38_08835 [Lucilia cuprina]|uniref:Uncharacterized protein n=1 Tax=Lucilia cuprina TaxID=7375 RepID=A0A0L0CBI2_LUCCU|nr:hypothetical protein FF38_08835 [Lucilia cuprina]
MPFRPLLRSNYHAGPKALMSLICQQFWIINSRNLCRSTPKTPKTGKIGIFVLKNEFLYCSIKHVSLMQLKIISYYKVDKTVNTLNILLIVALLSFGVPENKRAPKIKIVPGGQLNFRQNCTFSSEGVNRHLTNINIFTLYI